MYEKPSKPTFAASAVKLSSDLFDSPRAARAAFTVCAIVAAFNALPLAAARAMAFLPVCFGQQRVQARADQRAALLSLSASNGLGRCSIFLRTISRRALISREVVSSDALLSTCCFV